MDGFGENSGIIILAATNRPDVLDPALLRPGRFDRQVVIGIPDIKGREEIIKVHSKNKPLSDEVSPKILARRTPGFTPADIENLLNEAALITARRNGRKIRMAEIEEAATKVMAGPAKKSRVISRREKADSVPRSRPRDCHEKSAGFRSSASDYNHSERQCRRIHHVSARERQRL